MTQSVRSNNHAAIFLNAQIEKTNSNHIAKPGTLQFNIYNELVHIKVYLQYTLVEYSINAHNSPSTEATKLVFLVSLSDIH